jgi:hypothetical protein
MASAIPTFFSADLRKTTSTRISDSSQIGNSVLKKSSVCLANTHLIAQEGFLLLIRRKGTNSVEDAKWGVPLVRSQRARRPAGNVIERQRAGPGGAAPLGVFMTFWSPWKLLDGRGSVKPAFRAATVREPVHFHPIARVDNPRAGWHPAPHESANDP